MQMKAKLIITTEIDDVQKTSSVRWQTIINGREASSGKVMVIDKGVEYGGIDEVIWNVSEFAAQALRDSELLKPKLKEKV